ncbi:AraC family transcriptional regulator [Noviherbaspirillum denitrificans]|uniref:AraC family transcriptional regulator n=1 Tax=Noviherbaspirillum denitrificans TaxID=1968433 RepID=A0A254TDD5_9BURK|nr:AraC family transcriptional regulator [Noviherbaspirillum denitrificans]OWW20660.1 AraC family transcriptional regulator [Noviherbaspirillum denitrificans]
MHTATDRLHAVREALARSIAARPLPDGEPVTTAIPSLSLFTRTTPSEPTNCMYMPSLALVVQGDKRVMLGDDTFLYGAGRFLITSVDLPVIGEVLEASPESPFMALVLTIDRRVVTELIMENKFRVPRAESNGRGLSVGEASLPLLQAFQRLVDLLDDPDDIPALAPLIEREILYRLLVSDQGARLRQIASTGSQSHRIARAIDWLKAHACEPLRVDELAALAQMSTSTFHHHFRALTAMSPLQFQKWLRLNEARRLMLTEHVDASTAAFRVGYESPSQFGREYHRLFGAPPLRDITRLRQDASAGLVRMAGV